MVSPLSQDLQLSGEIDARSTTTHSTNNVRKVEVLIAESPGYI
jgi:hypothetical protein